MGLVVAKLKRPLRRFNVDNRARAVISKDKPTPAPKHAAAVKQLELAEKLNPNFLETHYKKDLKLDEHLKNVYVTSTDPKVIKSHESTSHRPLPQSRTSTDFEFGFYIPDRVPEGKCTLRQIFDIIIQHKEDSTKYNVNYLSAEYKLDKETIEKLLDYYKLYQLIMPPKEVDKEVLLAEQMRKVKELVENQRDAKYKKEEEK